MKKIYLLSPATTAGKRAALLTNPEAEFALALKFRQGKATLGEVFSFLSGLYFKGKLKYAAHFSALCAEGALFKVITAGMGLLPADYLLTPDTLESFSRVDISNSNKTYLKPLHAALGELRESLSPDGRVILLGSVATPKYAEPLMHHFRGKLYFPIEFKGRGDMSRGALMLRAVEQNSELTYEPLSVSDLKSSKQKKAA